MMRFFAGMLWVTVFGWVTPASIIVERLISYYCLLTGSLNSAKMKSVSCVVLVVEGKRSWEEESTGTVIGEFLSLSDCM